MAKATTQDPTAQIKEYRKKGLLTFGRRENTKLLQNGGLEKVYLPKNCPADVKEEIEHFGKLASVPVESLGIESDELGVICRRQHTIVVLGLRKE